MTLSTDTYVLNQVIDWGTGTGKIIYTEGKQYLVELITGSTPTAGASIGSDTVVEVLKPTTAIRKIFSEYSKPSSTETSEYETINEIGHTIHKKSVTAKTRKIKTMLTKEVLFDFENQFGEDFKDIIINILEKEITEELENEVFNYMSDIAVSTPDLMLDDQGGTNTLIYVYTDIYTRIFKEIANISKNTGRNLDCFIVTSSEVIAALAASEALTWAKSGDASNQSSTVNSNYIGTAMGVIDVFQNDFPDKTNEVIVGYKSKTEVLGDAGIIYSPYNITPYFAVDPETGMDVLYLMVRYNFSRNLLDSGTDVGDSDYFRKFTVDFSNVTNY